MTSSGESWSEDLVHLAQLHEAMLAASAGSCAVIKAQIIELERKLGISYEVALARNFLPKR